MMHGQQYPPQGPPPPQYFQNGPWGQPPKPPQNPVDLWRVVGLNFGIFMFYQTLLALVAEEAFIVVDMFPLILHWLVMLIFMIIAFSRGKRMAGFGWLISLIVFIIVGFGSCWWIGDVLGMPGI